MNKQFQLLAAISATVAILAAPGATFAAGDASAAPSGKRDRPARVEVIEGSKLKRVIVTEMAAKRLDIQTGEVGKDGADQLSAPYASILYDIGGGTWVYTMPQALTFVRQSVVVQSIKGEKAFLKSGPSAGTKIVTVGVAELYGAEKGVGH